MYNGRTDPMEYVSHFNQRIGVYLKNETLMCKVFPSSLGPVAMRWFDGLREGSINSFKELTRAFSSHFVTCSRVHRPLNSLLSMTMREGETLKTYSDRYWEMFNKIDGNFDDVAIRTFRVSLPTKHDLKKSLTRKPIRSVCVSSWTVLTSISGSRRINSRGRGKLRWSLSGCLILLIICLSIKQNLGHAWLFVPHTLDKLILLIICFSIK